MKRKIISVLLTLVLVLSFSLVTAVPAAAAGPIGDPFFTTDQLGTVEWSTEQVSFGDYSAKLYIPPYDSGRLYDEARVVFNYNGDLNSITGVSFPSYVIGGNDGALYPMVVLAVDSTGDENVDSWVCQWGPYNHTPLENAWETISFDGDSPVHVAGARTGLPVDHYLPYTTEFTESDTLALLKGEPGWATVKVLEVKAFMGSFTNLIEEMTAYVDDITINSVTYDLEPAAQAPVDLGTAANFAILAKTAVSTVPASVITGDVGVSPAATSFLTGFSLTMVGTTSATSTQVIGSLYGADMTSPTDSNLTTAVLDMEAAYTDAAGRPDPNATELGAGNIGGLTLAPGLYKWGTGVTIPTDVTLSGGADDVWIFQIAGTLDISSATSVILSGGAQAKNIFWAVADVVSLGTTSVFNGNILAQTMIAMTNGATLNGRALAQTEVTLIANTITAVAVSAIEISPDDATILTGETQAYTAVALDEGENAIGDVTADTTFSIDEDAGGSWTDNTYTSEEFGTWTVTGTFGALVDPATLNVDGIILDSDFYKTGDTVAVTVGYQAGNTSPTIAQTAQVKAKSTSTGTDEVTIAMHETGVNTGIFTGSFTLVNTSPGVGQLLIGEGDTITVTFYPPEPDYVAMATVDTTAPEFAADTEADEEYYANGDTITLTVTLDAAGYTVTGNFSAIDSEYTAGDELVVDNVDNTYTVTYDISADNAMLDGEYTITVAAEDGAGNPADDAGFTTSVNVNLDNTAPTVTDAESDPSVLQPGVATDVLFTVSVSDDGAGILSVSANLTAILGAVDQEMYDDASNGDETADDGIYSYEVSLNLADEETYDLGVTATDEVGNANSSESITLRVVEDVTAPEITSTTVAYPLGFESARVDDGVIITAVVTDDLAGVDTVTVNATAIGLGAAEVLALTAEEDTYSATLTVQAGTTVGTKTLTITATDEAANPATENVTVVIVIRLTAYNLSLEEGWNLFSLPLVPDDSAIDVIFADITDNITSVWKYVYADGVGDWKVWGSGPADFTEMDDGVGYWIETTMANDFTLQGVEIPAPPSSMPAYDVYEGWNLIGFKEVDAMPAGEYLGVSVTDLFERMYGYNAADVYYVTKLVADDLDPGQGYWLAVSGDGTIYP